MKRQLTPVLLPGKSHGQRSLVDYSPWDGKESDMTERLHFRLSTFKRWLTICGRMGSLLLQHMIIQHLDLYLIIKILLNKIFLFIKKKKKKSLSGYQAVKENREKLGLCIWLSAEKQRAVISWAEVGTFYKWGTTAEVLWLFQELAPVTLPALLPFPWAFQYTTEYCF